MVGTSDGRTRPARTPPPSLAVGQPPFHPLRLRSSQPHSCREGTSRVFALQAQPITPGGYPQIYIYAVNHADSMLCSRIPSRSAHAAAESRHVCDVCARRVHVLRKAHRPCQNCPHSVTLAGTGHWRLGQLASWGL